MLFLYNRDKLQFTVSFDHPVYFTLFLQSFWGYHKIAVASIFVIWMYPPIEKSSPPFPPLSVEQKICMCRHLSRLNSENEGECGEWVTSLLLHPSGRILTSQGYAHCAASPYYPLSQKTKDGFAKKSQRWYYSRAQDKEKSESTCKA